MALVEKVIFGVSWNFAARAASQILQAIFSIVLARLLGPSDIGIIGMLAIFIQFAQILADGGLSSALIYNQRITERHRSTVYWSQLAIGVGLFGTFFFGAPLIAMFY